MGQRTLAFTKQMLRVFNFIELEEPDHLVAKAWLSIPWSSEMDHDIIATRRENEQAQANKQFKAKHNQNLQYEIELASMVAPEKETLRSK
jgi:hypothetical protein